MSEKVLEYIEDEIEKVSNEIEGEVPRSPHHTNCMGQLKQLKKIKEIIKKEKES